MSKSVLISIQPYWVFLIIAKAMEWDTIKEKTVEVRKGRPKAESWNKVAKIYCSKDKKSFAKIPKEYQPFMKSLLGKVIGEFVCDEMYPIKVFSNCAVQNWICFGLARSEISLVDVAKYIGANRTGYGWHISNLTIYDKPKELSEFCKPDICTRGVQKYDCIGCWDCEIKRPPLSWCYVEEKAIL